MLDSQDGSRGMGSCMLQQLRGGVGTCTPRQTVRILFLLADVPFGLHLWGIPLGAVPGGLWVVGASKRLVEALVDLCLSAALGQYCAKGRELDRQVIPDARQ